MANGGKRRKKGGAGRKQSAEECDALGRRLRAERRRIEALRARMEARDEWGHHRVIAGIAAMAKAIREELKLSLRGAGELAGMSAMSVRKFEGNKSGGRCCTLGELCRAYGVRLSSFFLRIERKDARRSRPQG